MIKFVSDLQHVGGFLRVLRFLNQQNDNHDITEILLKVALNTITITLILLEKLSCDLLAKSNHYPSFILP